MSDTVDPPATVQSPLYDLMARNWKLDAAVHSACIDTSCRTVAFALTDGRVALAPVDDPDSAIDRMRVEGDTGRALIRARTKPFADLVVTKPLADSPVMLAPSARTGFVAGSAEGRLTHVTPRGQTVKIMLPAAPLSAIATNGTGDLALARPDMVEVHDENTLERQVAILTSSSATGLAFARDGKRLAVMQDGNLILWQAGERSMTFRTDGDGGVTFSADGNWLAGSGPDNALWLLRQCDGEQARIGNFRARPASVAFGPNSNMIHAAGAFRIAGWSLQTPPFEDPATGALRTGKPGMVLIERVATHPKRDLVACGMADGAVTVAQPGHPEEMMLRQADGSAITALHWGGSGTLMVIATDAGDAALLTLPPQLFK